MMNPVRFTNDLPRTAQLSELFGNRQSALRAVLVKSVTEIAAAEPRPAGALDGPKGFLRCNGRRAEHRMIVGEGGFNFLGMNS